MKRTFVISGVLPIVLAVAGFALWQHNRTVFGGGFTVSGHHMGEPPADFAKIEAKRYNINLDDCDGIGRVAKREVCDELVKYRNAKPEDVKNTRIIYNKGGWVGPGVPNGLSKPWEVIFVSGKLEEIHFWTPDDQYVAWLQKNYGKPDVSEHQPDLKERNEGVYRDQVDRFSHWEIQLGGKDKIYINITDAMVHGRVIEDKSGRVEIHLCSPCIDTEDALGNGTSGPAD